MVTLRHPNAESILQVIFIFVLKIIHLFTKLKFFPTESLGANTSIF